MDDVLIVGAGPAGAVAATVLARAGARVRVIDRAAFPRDKLCGDTLNPGCLALLRRLQLAGPLEGVGLDVAGMMVTGEGGVAVEGRYPQDLRGRSIRRRDLDWALLGQAMRRRRAVRAWSHRARSVAARARRRADLRRRRRLDRANPLAGCGRR